MKEVPNIVKKENDGKGAQLEYVLISIAAIETVVLGEKQPADRIVEAIDDNIISDFELKIEELQLAKQSFNDLHTRVQDNEQKLKRQVINEFNQQKAKIRNEETKFLNNLKNSLVKVSFTGYNLILLKKKMILLCLINLKQYRFVLSKCQPRKYNSLISQTFAQNWKILWTR